jgi:hypothetical protein
MKQVQWRIRDKIRAFTKSVEMLLQAVFFCEATSCKREKLTFWRLLQQPNPPLCNNIAIFSDVL